MDINAFYVWEICVLLCIFLTHFYYEILSVTFTFFYSLFKSFLFFLFFLHPFVSFFIIPFFIPPPFYFYFYYYYQIISVTCLFLASKAEESPKKLRDMVAAYFNLRIKFNKPQPSETVGFILYVFVFLLYCMFLYDLFCMIYILGFMLCILYSMF